MINVFRIFREYSLAKRELARMLTQIYPGMRLLNSLDGLVSQVDAALAMPALQAREEQLLRRYESEPDESTELRQELVWFALLMEAKLRQNDYKGGWKQSEISWLLIRMNEEYIELIAETTRNSRHVL